MWTKKGGGGGGGGCEVKRGPVTGGNSTGERTCRQGYHGMVGKAVTSSMCVQVQQVPCNCTFAYLRC